MTKSTSASLKRQRAALETERAEETARLESLRAELDALAADDRVEASTDGEFGEAAATPVDRDRVRTLVAQVQAHLQDIDGAIRRIETGGYGRCEVCGEPIAAARLEAVPTATSCVRCKAGGLAARRAVRGPRRPGRRAAA